MKKIILILFPLILFGQIKKPGIEPIKPPIEEIEKAHLVLQHQDVTIDEVDYKDATLDYEFTPIVLNHCGLKELVAAADSIKENAEKMTMVYRDEKLGKVTMIFTEKISEIRLKGEVK